VAAIPPSVNAHARLALSTPSHAPIALTRELVYKHGAPFREALADPRGRRRPTGAPVPPKATALA